jgi:hypothetical protein
MPPPPWESVWSNPHLGPKSDGYDNPLRADVEVSARSDWSRWILGMPTDYYEVFIGLLTALLL